MFRRSLPVFLAIFLATGVTPPVRAQSARLDANAVGDAWLTSAVRSEQSFDGFGRYFAFGVSAVLGGFLLVAPPLVAQGRSDIGWPGAAVSLGAGALLLTGAVSSVLISDPHSADRWSTNLGALGMLGMSAALAVSSLEAGRFLPELSGSEDSGRRPGTLSTVYGATLLLGFTLLGYSLSALIVDSALALPSAIALRSELATLSPDDRYDRIRECLQRGDQRRAWEAYTCAAANWLVGGFTWYAAIRSNSEGGQVLGAYTGLGLIFSGPFSLISYWISDSQVALLDAGELPHGCFTIRVSPSTDL
jgi:hypothetical protein